MHLRKRAFRRTPDKPTTPPRAPPTRPSLPVLEEPSQEPLQPPHPPPSTAFEPPPSTAPARLHRHGRERKPTAMLVAARREGWLTELWQLVMTSINLGSPLTTCLAIDDLPCH